jgi:ATP-dependent metalloprotease
MGGRVAEELIFGKDLITTGAQNDLESATKTAKLMVEQFGMGSVNRIISKEDGPLLLESISLEIDELLERQYQRSKEIITSKRGTLDLIASLLQEHESLDVK